MAYKETTRILTVNITGTEVSHKEKFEVLSENLRLLKKRLKFLENYEFTHSLVSIKINYEEIIKDYQNMIIKIKNDEEDSQKLEIKLRNLDETIAIKENKIEAYENNLKALNFENEDLILKLENAKK